MANELQDPSGEFWHSWERGYTPWDIENDRNLRKAGVFLTFVINDFGIVDVPSNPSPGDLYIIDSNASGSTTTSSSWNDIIANNSYFLDDTSLSTINNKIVQWVDIPRDGSEEFPEVDGEQWELYTPVDGIVAWEPSTEKTYRYHSGSWSDITDSFSDLDDTPTDYSGASNGDLVVVNSSTDGLDFTSSDASSVGAVDDAGGTPSIETDTKTNRPSAGSAGRIFLASDTREVFRDTGSSWELIALAPGEIDPGELGFDPATQTELDNHTGDTSNPHSVDVTDIQIDADDLNFDTATQTELDNHTGDTSNPHSVDVSDIQIDANDLNFDTATQTELDNHSGTAGAHHTEPSAGTGIKDEGSNQFGLNVVKSGNVTLSSNTAIVETGISTAGATFNVAIGMDDPNADAKVNYNIMWDESLGTDGEYAVEFNEDGTAENPTVNYDIFQIS